MSDGSIIISNYKNAPVVTAVIDSKLEFLNIVRDSDNNKIFVGKVDHIVKNLDAAFVKYKDEEIGYLPLKNLLPICITDNNSNGIKNGSEVIVQVESEAVKTKKCKLTTSLCVSGKYTVITLGRNGVGASLKLSDEIRNRLTSELRDSFKELVNSFGDSLNNTSAGMIIRTEVLNIIDNDNICELILEDAKHCLEKLSDIISNGRLRTIYSCLYEPTNTNSSIEGCIEKAKAFLKTRDISDPDIIEDTGIHGIKSKIDALLSNKIWLKSGAFIIIEQLESFNAIDVNTGKAIKGKENISEKVNFEAANEIMRQIRLRNLTGMILIDFINMKDESAYKRLTEHIISMSRKDPVHMNFVDITGLGIMELTRNKNDKTLKEILLDVENGVDNR